MAAALHRLGRFSFIHRRAVVLVWMTIVIALGALLAATHRPFSSQFSIPGTSSQRATDLLARVQPSARGGSGTVVLDAPAGGSLTSSSLRAAIEGSVRAANREPGIVSVSDPYTTGGIARDDQIARASVSFRLPSSSVTAAQRLALMNAFAPARSAGLRTYFGGDAAAPLSTGSTQSIGIGIALVILLITFGSLLTAWMPLISAILGVGIGLVGIGVVNGLVQLNSTSSTLASMLGLAVGIDYALFIITRYRSTVRALGSRAGTTPVDLAEAVGTSVATAGSAVVFAGCTVVIALSAMAVCGIPFLTQMGLAGAGTVAVAVAIALTLIPALLGFAGDRALKGKMIDAGPAAHQPTWGRRWGAFVTRHRVPAAIGAVIVLVALGFSALGLREGLPVDGGAPVKHDSTARL